MDETGNLQKKKKALMGLLRQIPKHSIGFKRGLVNIMELAPEEKKNEAIEELKVPSLTKM